MKSKKNKKSIALILKTFLAFVLLALGFFRLSQAQTIFSSPRQINISARIVNQENKEIPNGDYSIRFSIYTVNRETVDPYPSDSDSAQRVWSETQTVQLQNGFIEAFAGAVTPLPESLDFTSGNYYLGIRINSDSEMVPRKRIGAMPLAINSFQLQGAGIGDQEGDIPVLGTGGLLDVKMIPQVTELGTISAGVWEGDQIESDFIADAFTGKTYDGLTLTENSDGFSIAGGSISRTLTLTGGNVILNGPGLAGSIAYSNGTGYAFSAVGTAGQVLTSNGSGVPTWEDTAGVVETDPVFGVSAAAGIVAGDVDNWDMAYGWGDHSLAGYITDGNTGWDNFYGYITDLSSFTTDNLTQGSTNLYSQWVTTGSDIYYNTGNVGIGTIAPTNSLSFGSLADQKIWIEDTNGTAGKSLTIAASGVANGSVISDFLPLSQTLRRWVGIAVHPNGNVYATDQGASDPDGNGDIFMQTAGAGDFISLNQTGHEWRTLTVAPNGNVYACAYLDDIFMQTGGTGNFVALNQTHGVWRGLAAAPNGDVYAAAGSGGDATCGIYKQTGGSGDFVLTDSLCRNWVEMAAAPNGDIYILEQSGDIYKQAGGTGDFLPLGQINRNWRGITVTANGDVFASVFGGDIYKQTGGTGDFVALNQASRDWHGMAEDLDGEIYSVVFSLGDIYKRPADPGGGNLVLSAGAGKGTGESSISFVTGTTLSSGGDYQTPSEKMTLLGNGYLGIGTTTPNEMLTIQGSQSFYEQSSLPSATSGYMKLYSLAQGSEYDSYTKLMLHMDGTNGSEVFVDETGKDVTNINGTQISNAQSKFGESGIFSVGSLSLGDSSDWTFGTGDFTVDFWFRASSLGSYNLLYVQGAGGHYAPINIANSNGDIVLYISSNGTSWDIANGVSFGTPSLDTWYHLALAREGTHIRMFWNGSLVNTIESSAAPFNSSDNLYIGGLDPGFPQLSWQGYMDEVRVSKGIARWTAGFTPPNAPYAADFLIDEGLYAMDSSGNSTPLTGMWSKNSSDDVYYTSGNIGIGDDAPDNLLEIMSSGAANTQFTISNTNAGDYDSQIGFELADGTNIFTMGVDDSDSDKFKISTTGLGTNDRFVIDSSGNVGIGISAPTSLLHASGTLGANSVVNGTFDSDTSWTKGANWTISGNVANAAAATLNLNETASTVVVGKYYKLVFDATVTSGTVRAMAGGWTGDTISVTESSITRYFYATTNGAVTFDGVTAFTGTIDNVVLQEVQSSIAFDNSFLTTSDDTQPLFIKKVLSDATGDQVALQLAYEVNKADGNGSGLLIDILDTASPGTASYPLNIQSGGSSLFNINDAGTVLSATGAFRGIGTTGVTLGPSSTQSGTADAFMAQIQGNNNKTAGTHKAFQILPVYNQTSGTAANTDLLINRTETALGSGAQKLISAGTGGGTYVEKFSVDNAGKGYFAGNVGIGITPTALLHLGGTAGVVSFEINSNETTAGNNVLAIRSDVAGADDLIFRVQADGAVYADGAYTGTGADYAEYFETADTDLESGEAVCIDPLKENSVKRCVRSADNNVMGIVSSNPSIVGNSADGRENDPRYKIVAMLGQIQGKVSSENGTIQVGDSLTSSAIPGYLRKANPEESTVGIALQNFAQDQGSIQILISRRNKSLTVEKVEEAVSQRIAEMNVEDQVNSLISSARTELDVAMATLSQGVDAQIQTLSANLEAQLAELQSETQNNLSLILQNSTDINTLTQKVASILNDDPTSLASRVKKLETLNQFSSRNLENGGMEIIIVDPESPTIGEGVILAGESLRMINTKAATNDSRIYITPVGPTNNQVIYVGTIAEKRGFEVKVDRIKTTNADGSDTLTFPEEIKFNWWIVQSHQLTKN